MADASEKKQSKKVEEFLQAERRRFLKELKEPKILILGSSDSGKSTFLKQLKILHGSGFSTMERIEAKKIIFHNVMSAIKQIGLISSDDDCQQESVNELSKRTVDFIVKFRDSPDVHQILEQIGDYTVPLSTFYFFTNIERVAAGDYIPTDEDMLQVRQVTQSVSETIFEIDKLRLHIYDVSGLRMHRSHWLKYFDEVMTVIFLVALSSYDQVLLEDPTVNRMADAIVLFDQIANHPLLQKLELMLFFNKKDIFEKKVAKSSINQYFPEYQGKHGSISQGFKFFKGKFLSQSKRRFPIVVHLTCCTDTSMMKSIISTVIEGITKRNVSHAGLC